MSGPQIACTECQESKNGVKLHPSGVYSCALCWHKIDAYLNSNGLTGLSGWVLIDAVHLLNLKTSGAKQ